MGQLSDYAENKLLDHVLGNGTFTRPAQLFFALCKTTVTDSDTGSSLSEPSTLNGYKRKSIDTWDSAASRATVNTSLLTFPTVQNVDHDTIFSYAVIDTVTVGTGNIIAYDDFSPQKFFSINDIPKIAVGDINFSWNTDAISDYLANALLDHLFKGSAYTVPTSLFIGFTTGNVVDADTGSTVSEPGNNYARKEFNTWSVASGGISSNSTAALFTTITTGWGTITDYILTDHLSTGNIIFYKAFTVNKITGGGDVLNFELGNLKNSFD